MLWFFLKVSLQYSSELNNIFQKNDLKIFTFYVKLIDDRKRPNNKNIESFNLTWKVNILGLWREN